MSRLDPRTIGITAESRRAQRIGDLNYRMAVQERRPISVGSVGGSASGEVTGTIPGTLTINPTATPRVTRLGVGVAAHASAALKLQAASLTTQVLADEAHGENVQRFGTDNAGLRYNIYHGSAASPWTGEQSTFKVSVVQERAGETINSGADFANYSAILGAAKGTASTTAQPVGVAGIAINTATATYGTANTDACGMIAYGIQQGSGTGYGIGIHCVGARTTDTGMCYSAEFQTRNATTTDGVLSTTGLSTVAGQWIVLNDRSGGSGIDFGNPFGFKWHVGIHFKSGSTGPINTSTGASIRDDGQGAYSYLINGTHTSAAIAIDANAGQLLVGLTSSAVAEKARIRAPAATDTALCIQAAASASVNILRVSNSSDALIFGVGPSTVTLASGIDLAISATTGSKIGQSTSLIGFYGNTPVARTTAYTQTYATASRTHAAMTSQVLTDNSGGTASATLQAISATYVQAEVANNFADLAANDNALRADLLSTRQVLNQLIDDLQSYGLLQ